MGRRFLALFERVRARPADRRGPYEIPDQVLDEAISKLQQHRQETDQ